MQQAASRAQTIGVYDRLQPYTLVFCAKKGPTEAAGPQTVRKALRSACGVCSYDLQLPSPRPGRLKSESRFDRSHYQRYWKSRGTAKIQYQDLNHQRGPSRRAGLAYSYLQPNPTTFERPPGSMVERGYVE